ncbi:MAG: hypothetical protein D6719_10675 [Candidatus Dadabacteria bacterium]|nr:MAG: hypothetical protein D6719_10675 [Candidatus Dadabacteria bacterium]
MGTQIDQDQNISSVQQQATALAEEHIPGSRLTGEEQRRQLPLQTPFDRPVNVSDVEEKLIDVSWLIMLSRNLIIEHPNQYIPEILEVLNNFDSYHVDNETLKLHLEDSCSVFREMLERGLIKNPETREAIVKAVKSARDFLLAKDIVTAQEIEDTNSLLVLLGDRQEIDRSLSDLVTLNCELAEAVANEDTDKADKRVRRMQSKIRALIRSGDLNAMNQLRQLGSQSDMNYLAAAIIVASPDETSILDANLSSRVIQVSAVVSLFGSAEEQQNAYRALFSKLQGELLASEVEGLLFESLNSKDPLINSGAEKLVAAAMSKTEQELTAGELADFFETLTKGQLPPSEKLADYIADLRSAEQLGIKHALRYPPELLDVLIKNRLKIEMLGPANESRPLAVIVTPAADWNNAFDQIDETIREFHSAGYAVLVYEASNEEGLLASLRNATGVGGKQEKKAEVIILGGHGVQTQFNLGARDPRFNEAATGTENPGLLNTPERIDIRDFDYLKSNGMGDTLAPGGYVILLSCSTGKGRSKEANIGNMMREIFPQAATNGIVSPVRDVYLPSEVHYYFNPETGRLQQVQFGSGPQDTYYASGR